MTTGARRALALALAGALVLAAGGTAVAQADDDAAQQAAREISEARERANDAAAAYLEAESKLEQLELQQQQLRDDVDRLEQQVDDLRHAVQRVAVNRFMASGSTGIPILTDQREPNDMAQADVFAQVVSETSATTIDDYDAANAQLERTRDELEENQRALERSKRQLKDLQTAAEAEVERLREIESERLEDEAVQAALAAQQSEEQRQLEELQRRQAEAARTASGQLGVAPPAAVSGAASGSTSGNIGASGGDAGGRTGGGGAGSNPRAAGDGYLDNIICPVVGGSAYGDTWGAPRSGGRRHQGTDMLAPTGTPLQAVVSGTVMQGTNKLGGTTVTVYGDNGNRYYYAHLSAYEGVGGVHVDQGAVIGYIGDTGNARGTPHLHFEIHPHGGVAVNPYPSVLAAGC